MHHVRSIFPACLVSCFLAQRYVCWGNVSLNEHARRRVLVWRRHHGRMDDHFLPADQHLRRHHCGAHRHGACPRSDWLAEDGARTCSSWSDVQPERRAPRYQELTLHVERWQNHTEGGNGEAYLAQTGFRLLEDTPRNRTSKRGMIEKSFPAFRFIKYLKSEIEKFQLQRTHRVI